MMTALLTVFEVALVIVLVFFVLNIFISALFLGLCSMVGSIIKTVFRGMDIIRNKVSKTGRHGAK